jgi:hypothetical protein
MFWRTPLNAFVLGAAAACSLASVGVIQYSHIHSCHAHTRELSVKKRAASLAPLMMRRQPWPI